MIKTIVFCVLYIMWVLFVHTTTIAHKFVNSIFLILPWGELLTMQQTHSTPCVIFHIKTSNPYGLL